MALDTPARTWQDVVTERGRVGDGVEQCPCLYRFINFEDQVLSGLAPAAHVKMDCQAVRREMAPAGAKGLNGWLRVSMYQIASVSFLASEFDLGDLGAALAAEAAFGALVALPVERVRGGVDRGFHQPPAQVSGAMLGERATAVHVPGLVHARAQAGVAGQLDRR